jgi:hypothetical protein
MQIHERIGDNFNSEMSNPMLQNNVGKKKKGGGGAKINSIEHLVPFCKLLQKMISNDMLQIHLLTRSYIISWIRAGGWFRLVIGQDLCHTRKSQRKRLGGSATEPLVSVLVGVNAPALPERGRRCAAPCNVKKAIKKER